MCCNKELENVMNDAFDELKNRKNSDWHSCNVQQIANGIQVSHNFFLHFLSIKQFRKPSRDILIRRLKSLLELVIMPRKAISIIITFAKWSVTIGRPFIFIFM